MIDSKIRCYGIAVGWMLFLLQRNLLLGAGQNLLTVEFGWPGYDNLNILIEEHVY